MLTMAHWPELTQAFGGLGATILNSGELDAGLKQMIAFAVSNTAGCRQWIIGVGVKFTIRIAFLNWRA